MNSSFLRPEKVSKKETRQQHTQCNPTSRIYGEGGVYAALTYVPTGAGREVVSDILKCT